MGPLLELGDGKKKIHGKFPVSMGRELALRDSWNRRTQTLADHSLRHCFSRNLGFIIVDGSPLRKEEQENKSLNLVFSIFRVQENKSMVEWVRFEAETESKVTRTRVCACISVCLCV